ncbi:PilZ domain-containing protein [Pseudomonas sp. SH1-B]
MQSSPLLTQDELDFIQELLFKPLRKPSRGAASRLAIGEQLSELLSHVSGAQQLSLDTHSEHEHLSFPLYLIQDGSNESRLELGAPLIFEQGSSERPWRLELPTPLVLLDCDEQPSGLVAVELSNNGMLVRCGKASAPAKDQLLQLILSAERRVQLRARLARRVDRKHYAYSLQPLHAEDEQMLRQYLFEQHSERQRQAEAIG